MTRAKTQRRKALPRFSEFSLGLCALAEKLTVVLRVLRIATLLLIVFAWSIAPAEAQRRAMIDYASFSHSTHVTKQKLACDSCHKFPTKNWKEVRKGDAAFPDVAEYPEHASCLQCHRQQFFARERPVPKICSNCHVKATPIDTSRHPFPSLGEAFLSTARASILFPSFGLLFHMTSIRIRSVSIATRLVSPRNQRLKRDRLLMLLVSLVITRRVSSRRCRKSAMRVTNQQNAGFMRTRC
jgi:hypothetical protein